MSIIYNNFILSQCRCLHNSTSVSRLQTIKNNRLEKYARHGKQFARFYLRLQHCLDYNGSYIGMVYMDTFLGHM